MAGGRDDLERPGGGGGHPIPNYDPNDPTPPDESYNADNPPRPYDRGRYTRENLYKARGGAMIQPPMGGTSGQNILAGLQSMAGPQQMPVNAGLGAAAPPPMAPTPETMPMPMRAPTGKVKSRAKTKVSAKKGK